MNSKVKFIAGSLWLGFSLHVLYLLHKPIPQPFGEEYVAKLFFADILNVKFIFSTVVLFLCIPPTALALIEVRSYLSKKSASLTLRAISTLLLSVIIVVGMVYTHILSFYYVDKISGEQIKRAIIQKINDKGSPLALDFIFQGTAWTEVCSIEEAMARAHLVDQAYLFFWEQMPFAKAVFLLNNQVQHVFSMEYQGNARFIIEHKGGCIAKPQVYITRPEGKLDNFVIHAKGPQDHDARRFSLWRPWAVDLNRDGEILVSSETKVYFKVSGGGFKHATTWIDQTDAFMVSYKMADGEITVKNIIGWEGPFLLFGDLDANKDGIFDQSDDAYSRVHLWRDVDSDGRVQSGELLLIDRIARLVEDNDDEYIVETREGTYKILRASLKADNVNTLYAGPSLSGVINLEIFSLPELRGYGRVPNLSAGMLSDRDLLELVKEINSLSIEDVFKDFQMYSDKIDELLYRRAGVYGVSHDARGPNIDGRQLAFMEALMMNTFRREDTGDTAPDASTGKNLRDIYQDIKGPLMARILVQGSGRNLFAEDIFYDRLKDEIWFVGYGQYPRLSEQAIQRIAVAGKDAQSKEKYWAGVAFIIQQFLGTLNHLSLDEIAMLDKGLAASGASFTWENFRKSYTSFMACAECFSGREGRLLPGAAQKMKK